MNQKFEYDNMDVKKKNQQMYEQLKEQEIQMDDFIYKHVITWGIGGVIICWIFLALIGKTLFFEDQKQSD